ncbi:Rrbp1 [Symbiodinium necroappetens]|uniref:Rrbp1 protein n=1 Tax=Symbiodinium necroappetens TaxID=1628268 RepID=A0A812IUJ2_9DINO|nr:Rrbp1 [Symbiodinium necroappetens]
MDISRGYTDSLGRKRRVGGTDLTATGVYPGTMAMKVAGLLQKHLANAPSTHAQDEQDMELFDTEGDDKSDSGLEDVVGCNHISPPPAEYDRLLEKKTGWSKGKVGKGAATSGPDGGKEAPDLHLSIEKAPRTYEYVGRVPSPSPGKNGGKGPKGKDGAATKGKEKGKGKPSSNGLGGSAPECRTPTPKKHDPGAQSTGSPPSRPTKGAKGASQSDDHSSKSVVGQPGKGKASKGAAGALDPAGKPGTNGGLEPSSKGTAQSGNGSKGAKGIKGADQSAKGPKGEASKGSSNGADHNGKAVKGAVDASKVADQSGKIAKGAVKGSKGADQIGKGPKGEASKGSKGADQSGKGVPSKGSKDADQSGKGVASKGSKDADQSGKGPQGASKGSKDTDQSGKGPQGASKGSKGTDQSGKGPQGASKGSKGTDQSSKGTKGAKGAQVGNRDMIVDHNGKRKGERTDQLDRNVCRRVSFGSGLRKGLVAQWAATPPGSMARFEFLKAFLLDKDNLATIAVEPYYEELSESKEKEQFTELPLCLIRQKYDGVAGGKAFVDNLIASQTGKKHPQSDDKEMRLYKIFDSITVRDLSDKAVVVASGLGSCGLANQEGLIAQLGTIATECTKIQQLVFDAKPFDECLGCLNYYKNEILHDYQRQVTDAEGVWQGQERKAAQKRKLEKAEEKKKKKAKEEGEDEDAEVHEDGWEEQPDHDEDGEEDEWEEECAAK